MKKYIQYIATASLLLLIANTVKAQHYDNIYRSTYANLQELKDNNYSEHILKGATVLLPDNSNQLNLLVNIPDSITACRAFPGMQFSSPDLSFNLKVDIARCIIQQYLTSSKTFITHGTLLVNNISKQVEVSYMPVASGSEEYGNFNVYITVIFNPADFKLEQVNDHSQFVIRVNDAKVNRI